MTKVKESKHCERSKSRNIEKRSKSKNRFMKKAKRPVLLFKKRPKGLSFQIIKNKSEVPSFKSRGLKGFPSN